jgi:CRP-like cAMP-binding protein
MTELEKYIHGYFGVPTDDLAKIVTFFKPVSLKKGEYFLKAGQLSDRLGFVQSGIVREYVETNDKEVTKWISTKGYFVVDLASFVFHQPARWNFQAFTDTELFVIDQKNYQRIGQMVERWPELEKLFIAKCFTVLEERVLTHLSMTAEERYQQLFAFNKELFNQVPLQYLASMLGMTPETLSRLRKKSL